METPAPDDEVWPAVVQPELRIARTEGAASVDLRLHEDAAHEHLAAPCSMRMEDKEIRQLASLRGDATGGPALNRDERRLVREDAGHLHGHAGGQDAPP